MSVPPSRIPWHRLSEVMTDSLLVIDRQGYYCDLNAPAQALVGRSAADLVGQPWGEELLKLLGPEFRTQYDRALDQGEAQRLEMVAPDDGRRFQVQIVPTHGVIFLCLTEITDPKTLTPALNSGTEDYRTLADIIPVGIFHTDRTGNCCYVNDRWSQITGLSLAEALGTGWLQAVYPDDRDRLTTHWHEATQTDRVFQQEYRFQNPQGQITWVFGQAVAQYDSQGHVYGYVGTITDITQHKQVEAQNLRKAQRETALNRLFQTIHNSLDLETIFSTAPTEIAQTLKPWDCIVVQY
ncbi:MAG: PAS domain-containing protein, partial [Prochlorothrix sp.]